MLDTNKPSKEFERNHEIRNSQRKIFTTITCIILADHMKPPLMIMVVTLVNIIVDHLLPNSYPICLAVTLVTMVVIMVTLV